MTGTAATILFVDDDPCLRTVVEQGLRGTPYTALLAADSTEALAIFRARHDDIDLIIIDIQLPGMRGDALFAECRRIRPDVCGVLASGYTQSLAVDDETMEQLAGYLQKPFDTDQLIAKIGQVLGHKAECDWDLKRKD